MTQMSLESLLFEIDLKCQGFTVNFSSYLYKTSLVKLLSNWHSLSRDNVNLTNEYLSDS